MMLQAVSIRRECTHIAGAADSSRRPALLLPGTASFTMDPGQEARATIAFDVPMGEIPVSSGCMRKSAPTHLAEALRIASRRVINLCLNGKVTPENNEKWWFRMFSARHCSIRATLLAGLFSAVVVGVDSASADALDRTTQDAVTASHTGAPPVIPRPMAPGTVAIKPKPVLTVSAVKPIPRPVPRPRPVIVTPADPLAGTGGIKPVRPANVIPSGTGAPSRQIPMAPIAASLLGLRVLDQRLGAWADAAGFNPLKSADTPRIPQTR